MPVTVDRRKVNAKMLCKMTSNFEVQIVISNWGVRLTNNINGYR